MIYMLYLLLAIFCAIGIAEVVQMICQRIYKDDGIAQHIVILPLKGSQPQIEFTIRQIQGGVQWDNKSECQLFLVDMGMSDDSRRLVSIIEREIPGVTLCDEKNFPELLQENLRLQTSDN